MTTCAPPRPTPYEPPAPTRGAAERLPDATGARSARLLVPALATTGLLVLAFLFREAVAASVSTLYDLRWHWVPFLLLAQFVSTAAPAVTTVLLLRSAGVPVRPPEVLALTVASNAISVSLPLVGPELATAHTYHQLVRQGADTAATAWTLLVSGVAAGSTFALLAVAGLAVTGSPSAGVLAAGGAVLGVTPVVVLLALLRRPALRRTTLARALRLWRAAQRAGRRPQTGTANQLQAFLVRLAAHRLPRREAVPVVALALLNWLAEVACLALAVVAVGAPVPWQGLLLAYVAATAAGSLRLTPGGLGVVEAALTAGLVTAGLDLPQALAAALAYRLVSYWLVVVAGWSVLAVSPRAGLARAARS